MKKQVVTMKKVMVRSLLLRVLKLSLMAELV